jgi:DNA-binding XRE family transcriptional regulator
VAEPYLRPDAGPIEVVPVVVLSQAFPARPSSIPDIRNFVRRCLAESPLTEEGTREVGETVFRALLDAAGPSGSINVAFRIFPEHVEVDVLHSDSQVPIQPKTDVLTSGKAPAQVGVGEPCAVGQGHGEDGQGRGEDGPGRGDDGQGRGEDVGRGAGAGGANAGWDEAGAGSQDRGAADIQGVPASFAEWMSVALRREGLTQEAAARQLGVSVKTVSRWVGGTTEPRMRDLRRIQEVFGAVPLP